MSNIFNGTLTKQNLNHAFSHLSQVLSSKAFRNKEGLNGEVPFHICPYEPNTQDDVNSLIKHLKNDLNEKQIHALEVNLYDLVIEILKKEGDWEWLLENEQTLDRAELKEELQGIIDTEVVFIPEIVKKMNQQPFDILVITGVGMVHPYLRSSNLLENLQLKAKEKPTLMFFPGQYKHSLEKGTSLVLFGQLEDDKYYRAFNILDQAV